MVGLAQPLRLRSLMRPASYLHYLAWRASRAERDLTVRLRRGPSLVIRPAPAGDLSVAHEIFVQQLYRSPRPLPSPIKRIVDVGANVGYAINYFAHRFPEAAIVAFEPHPAHLDQIRRNLRANGIEARVRVVGAAAGTAAGRAWLADAGAASHLVDQANGNQIAVPVVDFFGAVGDGTVDLLKLDCEGAEFDLLMAPRFATLDARAVVLEWHTSTRRPNADGLIDGRLTDLGFAVEKVMEYSVGGNRFGLIWAYRS